MTPTLRKLYNQAKRNKRFNVQMKKADPNHRIPTKESDKLIKHVYATAYFGWLVGRKEFNREDYDL